MNLLRHIICLAIFCCSTALLQGQIISITEKDRGKVRPIPPTDTQIVDINATLEVELSKVELLKVIKDKYPNLAAKMDLKADIKALETALENQETILNILQQKVASVQSQQEFFALMKSFGEAVQTNIALAQRYEALSAEFFEPPYNGEGSMESFIFSRLNNDLVLLNDGLKRFSEDSYTISLIAFKKDKFGGDRVHIENFDTYSEREYVTIERWVTELTEAQKKELERLAAKAKDNNEKAISIFQDLKSIIKTYLPDVECILTQKDALIAFLNDPKMARQLTDSMKQDGSKLTLQFNDLINFINSIDRDVSAWSITTPFEIGTNLKALLQSKTELKLRFDTFQSLISSITAIQANIKELAEGFKSCYIKLEAYVTGLQNAISLLKMQQTNYLINAEIGEEVKAFNIDNLPSTGFINLKGTGARANGDELLIEVVLRIPSQVKDRPENRITLEQRSMYMQLLGARSEVAVGMILANPINKDNLSFETERKFYFSPSASLLLKFGSKKSYFYNEFIDLGVGINFATPDFDTDGSLEFGTGLIVTGFKDILSVGINYNVTLDAPYWFFGVNLPFNLPGVPINAIKN